MTRQMRLKQRIRNSPWRRARQLRNRKGRDARWDRLYGESGWVRPGLSREGQQ